MILLLQTSGGKIHTSLGFWAVLGKVYQQKRNESAALIKLYHTTSSNYEDHGPVLATRVGRGYRTSRWTGHSKACLEARATAGQEY